MRTLWIVAALALWGMLCFFAAAAVQAPLIRYPETFNGP